MSTVAAIGAALGEDGAVKLRGAVRPDGDNTAVAVIRCAGIDACAVMDGGVLRVCDRALALREPPLDRGGGMDPAHEHARGDLVAMALRLVAQQHVIGQDLGVGEVERRPDRQPGLELRGHPGIRGHPVTLPWAALAGPAGVWTAAQAHRHAARCLARLDAAVAAGLQGVGVSLDGLAPLHDELRGVPGAHARALDALRRIKAAGIDASVNTQIGARTLADLPALMDEIVDAGATHWQTQLTVAMGNAVDHAELLLQPHALLELMPALADLYRRGLQRGLLLAVGNNIGYFGPHEHLWRGLGDERTHWSGCGAGRLTMGIEADGTIKGCPSLATVGFAGGNVRDAGLAELWNTAPALHFGRLRDLDDMLAAGESTGLTKKELLKLQREQVKLQRVLGGIRNMGGLPDLMFVIDTNKESIAVKEARKLGIPVVAVVDTNCDPQEVDFPVPGNDDAARAIQLYCDLIADAVLDGLTEGQVRGGKDIGASERPPVEAVPLCVQALAPKPDGPHHVRTDLRVEDRVRAPCVVLGPACGVQQHECGAVGPLARETVAQHPDLVTRAHAVGLTVTVWTFRADEKTSYQIVGPEEAEIQNGLLSIQSPLARAILGKEAGDSVEVTTPRGVRYFEILEVRYD